MSGVSSEGLPRLHLLVSDAELERPDRRDELYALLERGAPIAVHLRTRFSAADLVAAAVDIVVRGGWCVVNGRPDVALAACAHGVQLGRTALSVADTRTFLAACGGELVIGASIHDVTGAESAVRQGADVLVAGTVFPTTSHPGDPGQGVGIVSRVAARSDLPVLAIGGIDETRIPAIVAAGGYGAVVSSAVWGADSPRRAAESLLAAIEGAVERGG